MAFSMTVVLPESNDSVFIYRPPKPIRLDDGRQWVCGVSSYAFGLCLGSEATVNLDSVKLSVDLDLMKDNLSQFGKNIMRSASNPYLYDIDYVRNVMLKKFPGKDLFSIIKENYKTEDVSPADPLVYAVSPTLDASVFPNESYILKKMPKKDSYLIRVGKTYRLYELLFSILGQHLLFLETTVTQAGKTTEEYRYQQISQLFSVLKTALSVERTKHMRGMQRSETAIFVKTNFTAPVITGERIDRTLLVTTSYQRIIPDVPQPTFVPVNQNFIESMYFEITDYDGHPIVFKREEFKSSFLMLTFKPTSFPSSETDIMHLPPKRRTQSTEQLTARGTKRHTSRLTTPRAPPRARVVGLSRSGGAEA